MTQSISATGVVAAFPGLNTRGCRSSEQPLASVSRAREPEMRSTALPSERSTTVASPLSATPSMAGSARASLLSATTSHWPGAVPISANPFLLIRPEPMGRSRPVTEAILAATSLALPAPAEITNNARPARSLIATPAAPPCAPWRPGLSRPAKGERAFSLISAMGALAFRIVEDWRTDDAFHIVPAQKIDSTNALADALAPAGEKADADVLAERRREGDRGEIALIVGGDRFGANRNEMRAGGERLLWVDDLHPDDDRPRRVEQRRTLRQYLADAILVRRDHAGEPKVARRDMTGDLGAAHMALLDAEHVQRLGAVGRDVELGAGLHQGADRCVAVASRHRDLVSHLA